VSGLVEVPVDSPGQIAFQASTYLAISFAFDASFFDVSLGFGVVDCSVHRDDVEGSVELAVTASVESVSHGVARGSWQWACTS